MQTFSIYREVDLIHETKFCLKFLESHSQKSKFAETSVVIVNVKKSATFREGKIPSNYLFIQILPDKKMRRKKRP